VFRQIGEAFQKYRERIREEAQQLKQYLKGRVIPGTESYYQPKLEIQGSRSFSRAYREHRKIKNKMARRSRRINRLRAA
jgi:hypothetical protein